YQFTSLSNRFFKRLRDSSYKIYNAFERAGDLRSLQNSSAADCVAYRNMMQFMSQLVINLQNQIYPSCTHDKLMLVIELYKTIIVTFHQPCIRLTCDLFHPNLITNLLNTFLDCWDKVRESLFELLVLMPSPLPCYETVHRAQSLANCARNLITSARQRESDAGALMIRLLFKKYVALGWHCSSDLILSNGGDDDPCDHVDLRFAKELVKRLQESTRRVEVDLFQITTQHALIGPLLCIRNVILEINLATCNVDAWKPTIAVLIDTIIKGCELAVKVISQSSNQDDQDESIHVDCRGHVYFDDNQQQADFGRVHALTVNCWLAVKECCMLLGTITSRIPLLSNRSDQLSDRCLLDMSQVVRMGQVFIHILLTTKHNGAIEKGQVGFQMLCKHLLMSDVQCLSELPSSWLDQVLLLLIRHDTSILRRSAGVPYVVIALLKAEPSHLPRQLLPRTMKFLFQLCGHDQLDHVRVHALNVIKMIFYDASLASHITQYVELGFIQSLDGFESKSWAVRNSSLMCYTALMQRALGNKKEKTVNHGLTSREFFSRYPTIRPSLISRLHVAVNHVDSLHFSLVPSLLLLSRLKPSADMDGDDDRDDELASLVANCANNKHYMARTVAAKALVPFIEMNRADEFVMSLFVRMDHDAIDANTLHGLLLEVYQFCKQDDYRHHHSHWMDQVLSRLQALIISNPCHVSRGVCFKMISRMLPNVDVSHDELESLMNAVVNHSLYTSHNLGTPVMLEHATRLLIDASIARNDCNRTCKLINELIIHPSFYVRVMTFRHLIARVDRMSFLNHANHSAFQSLLIQRIILMEKNVNGIRYGLCLLHTLYHNATLALESPDVIWNAVVPLAHHSNTFIREHAISFMGWLVRSCNDDQSDQLAQLLISCRSSTQMPHVRSACQRAIRYSGWLSSSNAHLRTTAWQCCVWLLQDEEQSIRNETSQTCAIVLRLLRQPVHKESQVDRVLEYSIKQAGFMQPLLYQLEEELQDVVQVDESPLFDKEPDNVYVDRMFLSQLSADLMTDLSDQDKKELEAELVRRITCALDLIKNKKNVYCVGDVSNNSQLFCSLYPCVLGLRALNCGQALKSVGAMMIQVCPDMNSQIRDLFDDRIAFKNLLFTIPHE
ncbi:hypothetical protein AKO1_009236, partial [Acrasis kona]